MKTLGASLVLGATLALAALAASPVMAEGSHGGAHGSAGHVGTSHYGGGFARAPGAFRGGYYGGARGNFAPGRSIAYSGSHFAGATRVGLSSHVGVAGARFASGAAWHYGRWGGGYWGGRFWPGVYWGANFAWFLPVLPAFYATYWWDNTPYYYYDNVYYTWDNGQNGYVVTNPPPASGDSGSAAAAAPPANAGDAAPPVSDNLYAYPKNGQSDEQQATDKRECETWSNSQSGASGADLDHRRAMTACLQGRGYSVD